MGEHHTAEGKRVAKHLGKIERMLRKYKKELKLLSGKTNAVEFKSTYEAIDFASKSTFDDMVSVWDLVLKLNLRFEAEMAQKKLQDAVYTACQSAYCREAIEAFEERIGVAEKRVLNILKGEKATH